MRGGGGGRRNDKLGSVQGRRARPNSSYGSRPSETRREPSESDLGLNYDYSFDLEGSAAKSAISTGAALQFPNIDSAPRSKNKRKRQTAVPPESLLKCSSRTTNRGGGRAKNDYDDSPLELAKQRQNEQSSRAHREVLSSSADFYKSSGGGFPEPGAQGRHRRVAASRVSALQGNKGRSDKSSTSESSTSRFVNGNLEIDSSTKPSAERPFMAKIPRKERFAKSTPETVNLCDGSDSDSERIGSDHCVRPSSTTSYPSTIRTHSRSENSHCAKTFDFASNAKRGGSVHDDSAFGSQIFTPLLNHKELRDSSSSSGGDDGWVEAELNREVEGDNVDDNNGHSSANGSSRHFKTSESNSARHVLSHNHDDMDDNVSVSAKRTGDVADSTPLSGGIAKSTARWNCHGIGAKSELATSPGRERGRSEPLPDESRNTAKTTDLTMLPPESQGPSNKRSNGDIAAQDDLVDSDVDDDVVVSWKRETKTPENDIGASAMAMVSSIAAEPAPYVCKASSSTIDVDERAVSPIGQKSNRKFVLGTSGDSRIASVFLPALDPHCSNQFVLASGAKRKKRSPAKILAGASLRGFAEADNGFYGDKLRSPVVENSTKEGMADPSALSESFSHCLDSLRSLILCSLTLLNAQLQRRRVAMRTRTLLLVRKFSL
jgi:hypothetical protein